MASYEPNTAALGFRVYGFEHRPDVSLARQSVVVARSDDVNHGSMLRFRWSDPLAHGWAQYLMNERETIKGSQ